jgi:serine/threonine protein phosphatase PrpC
MSRPLLPVRPRHVSSPPSCCTPLVVDGPALFAPRRAHRTASMSVDSGDVAPRRPVCYEFAHATDRGLVREQNEDAIAIVEDHGLALVADGMGGYNAGEVASGLAAEFLARHVVDDLNALRERASTLSSGLVQSMLHALLRARVDGANDAIINAASRRPELFGMGTTLAMLLFCEDGVVTLHLGDSRIYRMREDILSLLTRDHSLLQEQLDAGVLTPAEARDSISRNFVTRALGVDPVADPEINEFDLLPGDLYLICSDGLPDMLSDEEIFDLLHINANASADADYGADEPRPQPDGRVAEQRTLEEVAGRLVDAANARGGRDNVSVVLASVGFARSLDVSAAPQTGRATSRKRRRA